MSLLSLDSNILGKIASYLPESDQVSLRQVDWSCHQKLETEEQWEIKCRSTYPTSVKAPGVSWRDHFISCYVQNLPYNVAFRDGRQRGIDLAPHITGFIGLMGALATIPMLFNVINNSSFKVYKLVIKTFDIDKNNPFPIAFSIGGVSGFIFFSIIANYVNPLRRNVFHTIGQSQVTRNIFGNAWGNVNYYQNKLVDKALSIFCRIVR